MVHWGGGGGAGGEIKANKLLVKLDINPNRRERAGEGFGLDIMAHGDFC